jgi:hypothetical protein
MSSGALVTVATAQRLCTNAVVPSTRAITTATTTTTSRDAAGMAVIAVTSTAIIGNTRISLCTAKTASAVTPRAHPSTVVVLWNNITETATVMTPTTKTLADGTVVTAVVTLIPNTATIAYAWTPTTRALDVSAHTMTMDSVMMRITTRHAAGTMATAATTDTVASSGTVTSASARIPHPTLLQRSAKGRAAQINTRATNTAMMITTTVAAAGTAATVVAKLAM